MKAKKENKSYRISNEMEKQRYLKEGFDIYDDNGKLLEYSPLKKIAYSEYVKVKEENELLRAQIAKMSEVDQNMEAEKEGAGKKAQKTKAGA